MIVQIYKSLIESAELIDIDRIDRIMNRLVWSIISSIECNKNDKIVIEFHYNFGQILRSKDQYELAL